MNWYEHHIGDYDKNTSHLTACEDGIYSRMIRRYLDKEKPLPADTTQVERLMRARTKEEKQAVQDVLAEFFDLRDDGWHNKTCDETIDNYQAGEPEREVKKANEDNRQRRHREERARLFGVITAAGEHAPWNIGMPELRDIVKRIEGQPATPPVTAPVTRPVTSPVTGPATPATATHSPPTTHQPPTGNTVSAGPSTPPPPAKPARAPRAAKDPAPTAGVWGAYSEAYERRYGTKPVRNATVSGQLSQLVARLGADDAPKVARYYLTDNSPFFARDSHPVGLLLKNCEGLRTRWATGRRPLDTVPTGETPYQRSMRERVHEATGGLASARDPNANVFDLEDSHAATATPRIG